MYDDTSKKILVIEDDLEFRNTLFGLLGHEFAFIPADDGEQGIEKLLVHRPDLIILDLLLPRIDGFEVLKRIREYPDEGIKSTPVIILSNLSGNEDFVKATDYKVEAYFVKAHTKLADVKTKVKDVIYKGHGGPREEIADFRDMA
jgi:two-component system, OmpR family, response regulator MprA